MLAACCRFVLTVLIAIFFGFVFWTLGGHVVRPWPCACALRRQTRRLLIDICMHQSLL